MITRRKLIISGLIAGGAAIVNPTLSWATSSSPKSDTERFYRLSQWLTGRNELSRLVSSRALHCLVAEDAKFPEQLQALDSAIQTQNIQNVDQLNGHPLMSEATGETVRKMIGAWYLGYTGTPVSLRAEDNTRFVTYTDALMYQPTIDATVIPTYSRGHTNYWTQPPATIKQD